MISVLVSADSDGVIGQQVLDRDGRKESERNTSDKLDNMAERLITGHSPKLACNAILELLNSARSGYQLGAGVFLKLLCIQAKWKRRLLE